MNVCSLSQKNSAESGEEVWTGSGTILPHELKECNLEMTCPQHEPSVLAFLRVQFGPSAFCFIHKCVENCSINMYADDTIMYFTNLCASEIARVVQDDLNRVVQWMESCWLILNQSKTKSMLFGSNHQIFVYSYTERL